MIGEASAYFCTLQLTRWLFENNIPEDQSLELNTSQGFVVLTGCGHAGIINILTFAKQRFPNQPVYGIVGGLHLFPASDEQLNWTGDKLKEFRVANLLGAHCTGRGGLSVTRTYRTDT